MRKEKTRRTQRNSLGSGCGSSRGGGEVSRWIEESTPAPAAAAAVAVAAGSRSPYPHLHPCPVLTPSMA
uniref:Uncharacterized protein n=1 Tax=Leersia perrieri TaxID=77586 RepID=A0A0D9WAX5_9ORYZ